MAASVSVTPGNLSCELTGAETALSPYLIDFWSALEEIGDCAEISTVIQ